MAIVVGVTGGIASGKSTTCRALSHLLAARVYDADAAARTIIAREDVRRLVAAEVSAEAIRDDGTVNRSMLRDLIYSDPRKKLALETILHPRIRDQWLAEARQARESATPLLVDIPLLYETSAEKEFDIVVVVACSREIQAQRLSRERKIPTDLIEKMIASQMPNALKMARADHIVWSDGELSVLQSQIELLASFLHDRHR